MSSPSCIVLACRPGKTSKEVVPSCIEADRPAPGYCMHSEPILGIAPVGPVSQTKERELAASINRKRQMFMKQDSMITLENQRNDRTLRTDTERLQNQSAQALPGGVRQDVPGAIENGFQNLPRIENWCRIALIPIPKRKVPDLNRPPAARVHEPAAANVARSNADRPPRQKFEAFEDIHKKTTQRGLLVLIRRSAR